MRIRYVVALVVVAGGVWASAALAGGAAPSDTAPGVSIYFEANSHRPIAGHVFDALVIADPSADPARFVAACGTLTLGKKRLRGTHTRFPGNGDTTPAAQEVSALVCHWRIPKNAAGRRVRLDGAGAGDQTFNWVTGPPRSWLVRS
jgi:hypothetical protein